MQSRESMYDHRYTGVGDVYVGWDWMWDYNAAANEEITEVTRGALKTYTVSQYEYSTDNGWTKKTVTVNIGDDSPAYDFKDNSPASVDELIANYEVSSSLQSHEGTEATGAWNSETTSGDELSIVLSNTELTVSDGVTVSQDAAKGALLEIQEDIGENIPEPVAIEDSYFGEVVGELDNSEDIIDQVEDVMAP